MELLFFSLFLLGFGLSSSACARGGGTREVVGCFWKCPQSIPFYPSGRDTINNIQINSDCYIIYNIVIHSLISLSIRLTLSALCGINSQFFGTISTAPVCIEPSQSHCPSAGSCPAPGDKDFTLLQSRLLPQQPLFSIFQWWEIPAQLIH